MSSIVVGGGMPHQAPNAAMLIDFDNVTMGIRSDLQEELKNLLSSDIIKGKVAVRRDDKWVDLGQLGDATEVIGLTTYNGSLYAGTIPRAELFRFDAPGKWSSVRRLFDPPGFEPVAVGSGAKAVRRKSR